MQIKHDTQQTKHTTGSSVGGTSPQAGIDVTKFSQFSQQIESTLATTVDAEAPSSSGNTDPRRAANDEASMSNHADELIPSRDDIKASGTLNYPNLSLAAAGLNVHVQKCCSVKKSRHQISKMKKSGKHNNCIVSSSTCTTRFKASSSTDDKRPFHGGNDANRTSHAAQQSESSHATTFEDDTEAPSSAGITSPFRQGLMTTDPVRLPNDVSHLIPLLSKWMQRHLHQLVAQVLFLKGLMSRSMLLVYDLTWRHVHQLVIMQVPLRQ